MLNSSWQIQLFGMSKTELELETEDQKSIHKARLPVCEDGYYLLGEDSNLHLIIFGILL